MTRCANILVPRGDGAPVLGAGIKLTDAPPLALERAYLVGKLAAVRADIARDLGRIEVVGNATWHSQGRCPGKNR